MRVGEKGFLFLLYVITCSLWIRVRPPWFRFALVTVRPSSVSPWDRSPWYLFALGMFALIFIFYYSVVLCVFNWICWSQSTISPNIYELLRTKLVSVCNYVTRKSLSHILLLYISTHDLINKNDTLGALSYT